MIVPATKPTESTTLSVYDREAVIGFIIRRGPTGVEGFTAEGGSLGLFGSVNAAAIALWRYAHHQPVEIAHARP
jgi:hypothetical protein